MFGIRLNLVEANKFSILGKMPFEDFPASFQFAFQRITFRFHKFSFSENSNCSFLTWIAWTTETCTPNSLAQHMAHILYSC